MACLRQMVAAMLYRTLKAQTFDKAIDMLTLVVPTVAVRSKGTWKT